MQKKELLEVIKEKCGFEYISDLKFCHNNKMFLRVIKNISTESYSLTEWTEAAYYFIGYYNTFSTSEDAKKYLLNYMKK